MTITHDFCSTLSRAANEQLFGTGPDAKTIWLLLEYNLPWGAKVFPESDLNASVKAHLSAFLDDRPDSNILFIKQPGQQREGITLFIVTAGEQNPRLHRFTLESYDDLLAIDFAEAANDSSNASDEPLYLVCANSKRDACCARYGVGIYNALRQHAGEQAWQCSHIGGHRFAPTGLFFPHGICYGRIEAENVPAMISAYDDGNIWLENLRGRACYERPVQAADALLRHNHNLSAIDAVEFVESQAIGPDEWAMQFRIEGQNQNIRLKKVTTDVEIYTSCADDKTALLEEFRLV